MVRQTGAKCIMITSSVLPESRSSALMAAATELGLEVSRWLPSLTPERLAKPIAAETRVEETMIEEPPAKVAREVPPPPKTQELTPA